MKWFLVAIMTMTYNGGLDRDIFVWSNPYFQSSQECVNWVKNNNDSIYITLMREFPTDRLDRILCVNEENLKKFFLENEKDRKQETKS